MAAVKILYIPVVKLLLLQQYHPFNQPIGKWDVFSVTNMSGMFSRSLFDQPIGNWDVSNVIDMTAMFYQCATFNQSIVSWKVSRETDMTDMFVDAAYQHAAPNAQNRFIKR